MAPVSSANCYARQLKDAWNHTHLRQRDFRQLLCGGKAIAGPSRRPRRQHLPKESTVTQHVFQQHSFSRVGGDAAYVRSCALPVLQSCGHTIMLPAAVATVAAPHPQLGLVSGHDDFRLAVAIQVALHMQQKLKRRKAATS